MTTNVLNLISIIVFMAIGTGFVLITYASVRLLAPTSKSTVKQLEAYECGVPVVGQPWVHINIRYYLFAMLFLIFDIETVFLFPWALVAKKLHLFGLIEMMVFILILFVGLAYPWKKGVLRWDVTV